MKDLTDSRLIKLKGFLFLVLGVASALTLLLDHPTLKVGLLLALTIWCFCRAYYFAFYVIERYVDSTYRFSGLGSCVRYLLSRRRDVASNTSDSGGHPPAGPAVPKPDGIDGRLR